MFYPLLITILCILLFNLKKIKEYYRNLCIIQKIPGPKQFSILGNIFDALGEREVLFQKTHSWSKEYYPIYKLVFHPINAVVLTGPEDIELLITNAKHSEKSTLYKYLDRWLGEGLLTSHGPKWQLRRKLLTPAFHFNLLQDFVSVFQKETMKLIEKLERNCGKEIDVVPFATQFTLSSINETAMGISLNDLDENDLEYKNSILDLCHLFFIRCSRPWLYPNFLYYYLTPYGYRQQKSINIAHKFTKNIIEKNINEKKQSETNIKQNKKVRALLDLLTTIHQDGAIDLYGINEEISTFMFAGHDTSAMALSFSLMLIANNPEVQEKIFQEITQVFTNSNECQPTIRLLNELNYTERCIKECLRLYPSVPNISRKNSETFITTQNYEVPKGSLINVSIFDLHRMPHIYPDPEKFDPDRFLPENVASRHPFAFLPFSAGPRNCIGQKFAMVEIKIALCGILQKFILEPVDTPDTIVLLPDIVLRTKNGVKIKFVKRITKQ